ncbi:MAG TPA: hypothetical protein PLU22_25575, partial [Polyangiaceae bacterium]|nr:hypothetical protein [Polyangiaceae bacterium]
RLTTGEDRTALFYSVFSISMKAAMAAAVGIALPLVAWLGFDPGQRARVTADGDRVTLAVTLEPDEAQRLVELGLRAWSPRGADGAAQQP